MPNFFEQFDRTEQPPQSQANDNFFAQFDAQPTKPVAESSMSAYEPTTLETISSFLFPPNQAKASNELAAQDIANEQNVPVDEVYQSVGGSRPSGDPQGRSGLSAITEGYQAAKSAAELARKKATGTYDKGVVERIGKAVPEGWDSMVGSLELGRFALAGGDTKAMAQKLSDRIDLNSAKAMNRTPGEAAIHATSEATGNAVGGLAGLGSAAKQILEFGSNLSDAAVFSAEQAPNSVPTLGLGAVGAAAGGGVAGIPGAVIGGRIGMATGTTATEYGAEIEQAIIEKLGEGINSPDRVQAIEQILSDPQFMAEARSRGLRKGVTVAAVDQLFLKLSGSVAAAPGVSAKVGAAGLDMAGEGVGEYASGYAARGEGDLGESVSESLASGPTSIVETGIGYAMENAKKIKGNLKSRNKPVEPIKPTEKQATKANEDQEPPTLIPLDESEPPTLTPIEEPEQTPGQPKASPENDTGIYRVNVEDIQVDPKQYQFRTKVNKSGVDNRLEGVKQWDESRGGVVTLHRRKDGKIYVADGHHRVDLAKKLGQPSLNARFLDESKGVTIEEARTKAAMNNIADGKAEPVDIAKVMRNSGSDLRSIREEANLPNSQLVRDGQAIAKLSDNVFGLVVSGQLNEKDGATIGARLEQQNHDSAASVFQKVKPETTYQRELLIGEIKAAGFAETQGEQGGLFGDDPQEISLLKDRLKVLDTLRTRLNTDKRLFKSLNDNADRATEVGNQIDKESNDDITKQSAESLDLISRVATTPSLNEMVNRAAKKVHDGESLSSVAKQLQQELMTYDKQRKNEGAGQGESSGQSGKPIDSVGQVSGGSEQVPSGNTDGTDDQGERGARSEVASEPTQEEDPFLSSYTEAELQQQSKDKQAKADAEAKKQKAADDKEKADLTVDNFQLIGSNLPADVNPNQGDLLSEPALADTAPAIKPDKTGSKIKQRVIDILGANEGDRIIPSTDIGWSTAGKPYLITKITKTGEVYVKNEQDNSSTSWTYGDIKRATKDRVKFEKLNATGHKDLKNIQLKRQVEEAETGDVVEIEESAETLWRRSEKRGAVLKALLECVS